MHSYCISSIHFTFLNSALPTLYAWTIIILLHTARLRDSLTYMCGPRIPRRISRILQEITPNYDAKIVKIQS